MITKPVHRSGLYQRLLELTLALLISSFGSRTAFGQTDAQVPELRAAQDLSELKARPVREIVFETRGGRWQHTPRLGRLEIGQPFTPHAVRLAMTELLDSGRYASVDAEVEALGDGVRVKFVLLPRRIVASVRLVGGSLDEDVTLSAADLRVGSEVTALEPKRISERIEALYARRGFPNSSVTTEFVDTDQELEVVALVTISSGDARVITSQIFQIAPRVTPKLQDLMRLYQTGIGDRADTKELDDSDARLTETLRARGYPNAQVSHQLENTAQRNAAHLRVIVDAGPEMVVRFEGNKSIDSSELESTLDLEENSDRAPASLIERIRKHYIQRGFLDVRITLDTRGPPGASRLEQVFVVHEGARVSVVAREFPCLSGSREADDVGDEIDGILSEALPGSQFLEPIDAAAVNDSLGYQGQRGNRAQPLRLNPWRTYAPEVYARALENLQALFQAEGYLSATVGPLTVLRRQCARLSPAGRCIPIGPRTRPVVNCSELSRDDTPAPTTSTCEPDPAKGIYCEPDVVLHIPIKLGPRTMLWDVTFEGNYALVEGDLRSIAELELGTPVSQVELEKARRRLLDEYFEAGFAFAEVEVELELSPDRTRARVRFIVSERERVRIKRIVVKGAKRTRTSLILGRTAFDVGDYYRRSTVRATEERLATLGVFTNVSVSLEDPDVPAREKVVVISVQERTSQYVDVSPGFSTGEGVRLGFEYGHRNLGGSAIQFRLRVQLGFLPSFFILDDDVRRNFDELSVGKRLERRNTASLEFPEVGLGPLFRLIVDGVDVRDNSRDFGLTKDAAIVTLNFRPTTRFAALLGASLELNNAEIFGAEEKRGALEDYLRQNNSAALRRLLNVPEGQTIAVAQRIGVTWDRRDSPFGATKGTLVAVTVEHVNAFPTSSSNQLTSHFMRYTNRLAGYIRLSEAGLALAGSFRWGLNQQLRADSQTYPDRLFFLGGADSLRGFLLASMIPEDVAEKILDPNDALTVQGVTVRGGDVSLNPRVELRIPIDETFQTAVFVDSGNLWVRAGNVNPTQLRYTAGSGLRANTPIGPLAFDYGINLDKRPWEDRGAFHFSVGLF